MTGAFDNIHPGLSQGDAIRLLSTPLEELESQSDPYMAAAHLINFPGPETETALIALVMDPEQAQPRKLARRKAVEVLGRLGCQEAMAAIANCLNSDDPYLVENSAFALQQLNCQDAAVHEALQQLLSDPAQNRRVLIQSLAALNVSEAEPLIASYQTSDQPGVRGAAISASIRLGGSRGLLTAQPSQHFHSLPPGQFAWLRLLRIHHQVDQRRFRFTAGKVDQMGRRHIGITL